MDRIGDILRQARENKGITLQQASEATKISIRYLKALEDEAYQVLPARVYVIGFLRSYAAFLGLDGNSLVEQFKSHQRVAEENVAVLPRWNEAEKRRPSLRMGRYLVIILSLVTLLLLNYFYQQFWKVKPNDVQEFQQNQVSPHTPESSSEQMMQPIDVGAGENKDDRVHLVIEVIRDRCWLAVEVDGKKVYEGTLETGMAKTFEGRNEIKVRFGNAGAVRVVQNGKELPPMGGNWEVIDRVFTKGEKN